MKAILRVGGLKRLVICRIREKNAEMYTRYLEVVKNYERMSDLSTNLVEFYQTIFEVDESFSEEAMEDLDTMYQLLINMVERSANIFEHEDF